jgi:hypothetical protein
MDEETKARVRDNPIAEQTEIDRIKLEEEDKRAGAVVMLVAIIAGQFSPMNTRGVQDLLAFYFQHIGMRRRGIGLLNHLGGMFKLCPCATEKCSAPVLPSTEFDFPGQMLPLAEIPMYVSTRRTRAVHH